MAGKEKPPHHRSPKRGGISLETKQRRMRSFDNIMASLNFNYNMTVNSSFYDITRCGLFRKNVGYPARSTFLSAMIPTLKIGQNLLCVATCWYTLKPHLFYGNLYSALCRAVLVPCSSWVVGWDGLVGLGCTPRIDRLSETSSSALLSTGQLTR